MVTLVRSAFDYKNKQASRLYLEEFLYKLGKSLIVKKDDKVLFLNIIISINTVNQSGINNKIKGYCYCYFSINVLLCKRNLHH